MASTPILLALAGQPAGDPSPYASLVMMGLIFMIFYFVLIQPMKNKQRKLEDLVKRLKSGDKVILSGGIFGTIVGVDDQENAFQVRIDEKTRIKVLKSSVAALQGSETEKTEK
ncbi:MAG TPA: preprotein translocase subunit YajC [Vicinamibacteria bacterium]|jgi:preprotein translocase subunit YajC